MNSLTILSTSILLGLAGLLVPVDRVFAQSSRPQDSSKKENRIPKGSELVPDVIMPSFTMEEPKVPPIKTGPVHNDSDYDAFPPDFSLIDIQRRIVYPELARVTGIQGSVLVQALIGTSGKVEKAIIVRSDNKVFDSVAVAAVLATPFKPARKGDGTPVKSWVTIPIAFRLWDD
jgi:TonB family protein